MKRILVLILVFAFHTQQAQTPGFMGKRFTAGYGFYINPAISAAIIDYGTHVINTQHEFFLETTVKRRLVLGASIKLYNSTYNNTGNADISDVKYPNYHSSNYYSTEAAPTGSIKIKARNYSLYAKLYRRSYVAPWGKYFLLGFTWNTRECTYDPEEMYIDLEMTSNSYPITTKKFSYSNFGPETQNFSYPDLVFGAGNSRIFWKSFVLDYGYNVNTVAFALAVADAFDMYNPKPDKYVQVNSGMRVRGINRFNVFLKLGYLF